MDEELRTNFHEELDIIKQEVIQMANYVASIIPQVTEAFIKKDLEKAQTLIDGDDPLDDASVALDERCSRALALQQPMASDLRYIISAMAINSDIERSGDLAVNVAKAAHRLKDAEINPELVEIINGMSKQATYLVQLAASAYSEENLEKAGELDHADDVLDKLNYKCLETAINSSAKGAIDLEPAVQVIFTGRYYERIGDHAVNIGERIQYMMTGQMGG